MKKLAFVTQPPYFRFMYEDDLNDIFDVREFHYKYNMNDSHFNELIKFQADYNIFTRGEFFPEQTLKRLNGIKIALSSEPFPRYIDAKWEYTLDSIMRYLLFRRIRNKSFNYLFHYDISSSPLFEWDGLGISGQFIFPVALKTYKYDAIKKQYDIFFIGRSTKYREKYLRHLGRYYNFLHIGHGIWGADLTNYINKSRICLNIHAAREISWEPRIQILLACGAFVLSEQLAPNPYIRPGKEYIQFSGIRDLCNKLEYYLRNEEEMKTIGNNGRQRVLKYFDSRERISDLLVKIEQGKYPTKIIINNGSYILNLLEKLIIKKNVN